jgi:predicted metal-dependent hydrolase
VWAEGAALQFQGRELRLQLDPAAHHCQLHEQALILPLPRDAGAERIRDTASAWLQSEARSLLGLQLGALASRLKVPVPPWTLSFSSRQLAQFEKGQLRLNWKLVLLPPDNLEAVIRRLLAPHIIPPRSVGLFD